jgi:hypothetical protein
MLCLKRIRSEGDIDRHTHKDIETDGKWKIDTEIHTHRHR